MIAAADGTFSKRRRSDMTTVIIMKKLLLRLLLRLVNVAGIVVVEVGPAMVIVQKE
jgi:hypothetical protein